MHDKILNPVGVKRILSRDYVPPKIIDRKDQLKNLHYWVLDKLDTDTANNILITGYSGTGKTCVTKWLCQNKELNGYKPIFILCRDRTSLDIWKNLSYYVSDAVGEERPKGRSRSDFFDYFRRKTENEKLKFLIVLDEIDSTLSKEKSDDFLNVLLHIQRELSKGRFSLILISNVRNFYDNNEFEITDITESRLSAVHVDFDVYGYDDLLEILEFYSRKILLPNYLEKEKSLREKLIGFCKIVAEPNIRKLIEYLIIWCKECEKKNGELTLSMLNEDFFKKIKINDVIDDVNKLNIPEKLILTSLIKSEWDIEDLKHSTSKKREKEIPTKFFYTDFKRFRKYYIYLCNLLGETPLKRRRFKHYIKVLKKWDLIDTGLKSSGIRGVRGIYSPSTRVRDSMKEIIVPLCQILGIRKDKFIKRWDVKVKL